MGIVRTSGGGTSSPATTAALGIVKLSTITSADNDSTVVPTHDVVITKAQQIAAQAASTSQVQQKTGNYTLSSADHKSMIIMNGAGIITIPTGLGLPFECTISKNTSGDVVIATTITTVIRTYGFTGNKVNDELLIIMVDSNTVKLSGGMSV